MSKCPDCGRENVQEPEGHLALCGRRVTWSDAPGVQYPGPEQWRERMAIVDACKLARDAIKGAE